MPATIRRLLEGGSFDIRSLTPLDDDALDRPLSWVHSSDLLDPAPWLEPGNLLLTNGAPFPLDPPEADVIDYVARLRARDIAGVGFATDVIHGRVPGVFVRACRDAGLPVVEVAGRAPFIGIIRFVADIIAADRAARFSWLLDAQRAVARAGVREDGLREILRTLSGHLQTWVALYDAAGGRVSVPGLVEPPADTEDAVRREVAMLLGRRTAASLQLPPPQGALLQSIGQSGRLRGILAVGAREPLDPAEKDLVGTVVALASIALEQQRRMHASLRAVRRGIGEMLTADQVRQAQRVADLALGGLPRPPLVVGVVAGGQDDPGLLDELELAAADAAGVFFAERDRDLLVLVDEGSLDALSSLVERRGLAVGFARHAAGDGLDRAIRRAAHAATRAPRGERVWYDAIAARGLVGALRAHGGDVLSETLLRPLDTVAAGERRRLIAAARAWLDANGAWDPAARALGIHRHTLRARITQLEEILGLDLSTFSARAELWAALELSARASLDAEEG